MGTRISSCDFSIGKDGVWVRADGEGVKAGRDSEEVRIGAFYSSQLTRGHVQGYPFTF